MTRTGLLVVALALAGGCTSSPSTPSPAPVRVTVSQNPTVSGDSLVFGARVENISQAAVDLTFPSGCLVLPYFRDQRTGQLVTPAGGGFGCTTVFVQRTLQPGELILGDVTVKAGTAPEGPYVVLPPGAYTIQYRLEDTVYRAQSERLPFALR
jgi:Intracellular proteinase inhibitor